MSYMNFSLRIVLNTTPEQLARLGALQAAFAALCNALAPTVQQTRVWNRVALHHLAYRSLRERFPDMGSQMVCNAIYSVSRTSRLIFQHPHSPFNLVKLGGRPLPLLRFSDTCPVYFDRHTLSARNGQLSMFTLDGRMRFALALQKKLREIALLRQPAGQFELTFLFSDAQDASPLETAMSTDVDIPEYVLVEDAL